MPLALSCAHRVHHAHVKMAAAKELRGRGHGAPHKDAPALSAHHAWSWARHSPAQSGIERRPRRLSRCWTWWLSCLPGTSRGHAHRCRAHWPGPARRLARSRPGVHPETGGFREAISPVALSRWVGAIALQALLVDERHGTFGPVVAGHFHDDLHLRQVGQGGWRANRCQWMSCRPSVDQRHLHPAAEGVEHVGVRMVASCATAPRPCRAAQGGALGVARCIAAQHHVGPLAHRSNQRILVEREVSSTPSAGAAAASWACLRRAWFRSRRMTFLRGEPA